jgi:RHS repeat-associated protein
MQGRSFSSGSYRYGFNGMENDNEIKGDGNSLDFGARIYDSRLGRWLSVDPIQSKFPDLTPYQFVSNSPLILVDPNGMENIIYLVILPDAHSELSQTQKNEIIKKANEILNAALGVNTKVVLYEGSDPFDPNNIDDTDSYMVLGKNEELIEANMSSPYYTGDIYNKKELNNTNAENLDMYNPESSDRGDNVDGTPKLDPGGIIQFEGITGTATLLNDELTNVLSLIIIHGAIHNAYSGSHIEETILAKGQEMYNAILSGEKELSDFIKDTDNQLLKRIIEAAYGSLEPNDNYEKNKSRN